MIKPPLSYGATSPSTRHDIQVTWVNSSWKLSTPDEGHMKRLQLINWRYHAMEDIGYHESLIRNSLVFTTQARQQQDGRLPKTSKDQVESDPMTFDWPKEWPLSIKGSSIDFCGSANSTTRESSTQAILSKTTLQCYVDRHLLLEVNMDTQNPKG